MTTAALAGFLSHPPHTHPPPPPPSLCLPTRCHFSALTSPSCAHRVWVWGTRSEGKLGLGDELLSGDEGEPRMLDMMSSVQGRAVACGRAHTVALCSRRLMAESDSRFCMNCQKDFNWSRRPKHCHRLFCWRLRCN